jgi:hypothetical protein
LLQFFQKNFASNVTLMPMLTPYSLVYKGYSNFITVWKIICKFFNNQYLLI